MNRVVHFEIHAKDLDAVEKFYSEVFGWDFADMGPGYGGYRSINTGKDEQGEQWHGINGGLTPRKGDLPRSGQPIHAFVCTISVNDIDRYIDKVQRNGGTVVTEKMDVPGVGTLAYGADVEGNMFGLLQPADTAISKAHHTAAEQSETHDSEDTLDRVISRFIKETPPVL